MSDAKDIFPSERESLNRIAISLERIAEVREQEYVDKLKEKELKLMEDTKIKERTKLFQEIILEMVGKYGERLGGF